MKRSSRKRPSLQGRGLGSLDSIKTGLLQFYREHGHYPTAPEIDNCPYLCSSRYIQQKYGGLRNLRQSLGLDIVDYGKGPHRQALGQRVHRLSMQTENEVKEYLIERYGEICVHEEKKYGSHKARVDFFVYAKANFAVEVFNTYTIRDLAKNLNVKLHKYTDFQFRLYFVVTGGDFLQKEIDALILNKELRLLPNMQCLTLEEFKKECLHKLSPLRMNVRYTTFRQSEMPFFTSYYREREHGDSQAHA
jgi:hypothetical protein